MRYIRNHNYLYLGKLVRCDQPHALKTVALLCALANSPVFADSASNGEIYEFNISAGDISTALNNLAETANVELSYPAAIASDVKSNGLKGSYTAEQALQQLLKGSGLSYRVAGGNSITVEKVPTLKERDATAMPAVHVVGKAVYDSTDPYNSDYRLPNASTATKTDTPIMETPFSVQVVTKQVLQDQQVTRIDKAVQNVSGVTLGAINQGATDGYQIRGFQNNITYRDGVLIPTIVGGSAGTKRDTTNIERVEVLKGPGSILFGRAEPGGLLILSLNSRLQLPIMPYSNSLGHMISTEPPWMRLHQLQRMTLCSIDLTCPMKTQALSEIL